MTIILRYFSDAFWPAHVHLHWVWSIQSLESAQVERSCGEQNESVTTWQITARQETCGTCWGRHPVSAWPAKAAHPRAEWTNADYQHASSSGTWRCTSALRRSRAHSCRRRFTLLWTWHKWLEIMMWNPPCSQLTSQTASQGFDWTWWSSTHQSHSGS